MFGQCTIVAPGLLGASLGLALARYGLAQRVVAWARRPEARLACAETHWCAAAPETLREAVAEADLVVLCAPVGVLADLAREIAPALAPGTVVTDVGSTKGTLCREATAALAETEAHFVGSHPMAGSEKTGLAHARADLFAGRPVFVTPWADSDSAAVTRTCQLWRALEMEVTTLHPDAHDEIVAHISHLPHLLASALAALLGRVDPAWQAYSGQGLRDTTRIAAGSPTLWRDIFAQNRDEVLRALEGLESELASARRALHNRDWATLRHQLARGQAFRQGL